jgi:hypothetical protein
MALRLPAAATAAGEAAAAAAADAAVAAIAAAGLPEAAALLKGQANGAWSELSQPVALEAALLVTLAQAAGNLGTGVKLRYREM